MKCTVYLRVAEGARGPKFAATAKPNYAPLSSATGSWNEKLLPTAAFAIELDIPDAAFRAAETVLAQLELEPSNVSIAAEVAA